MQVPFVNLVKQYQNIKEEIDNTIQNVLNKAAFVGGEEVKTFEDKFAQLHGADFCIGTSSGTDSLHLILWCLGIGSGDEVIVPVNTFIATAGAASLLNARPVFIDNNPADYNLDASQIESLITSRTRAIIPVHLYGQPADIDPIIQIAERYGLWIIEDCCQAHIAEYKNQCVGTFGIASAFSFFCSKNLGAFGEGGAILTNDEELYKQMNQRHNQGTAQRYIHDLIGHNYRLEGIQAAILNVKMRYLESWTESRRHNALLYNQFLSDLPEVTLPVEMPLRRHVYHLFVIRVPKRNELKEYLEKQEISIGLHYPVPLHLQKAYADLGYKKGDFPIAETYADEILSLPMFPELTEGQIEYVSHCIRKFYKG
jgi:dTDP-4-amino-4,6-dideoxygalactose transaminase